MENNSFYEKAWFCFGLSLMFAKIMGVINLSWWWCTAPFWAPVLLLCAMVVGVGTVWTIYIFYKFIKFMIKDEKDQ